MPGSVGESFGIAEGVVNEAAGIVLDRIDQTTAYADRAFTQASTVIDKLAGTQFNIPGDVPKPDPIDLTITGDFVLNGVTARSFGSISGPQYGELPNAPNIGITGITIPDFVPSITGLTIPEAPGALDVSGAPAHPTLSTVTIPSSPDLPEYLMDALIDINVPTFLFPDLPLFTDTAPEFTDSPINNLYWNEPVYALEVLDEVLVQVRRYFAGGTGIPPAVEQALFARSNEREDALVAREVATAVDDFGTRGFTLPPGMLSAKAESVRQDALVKKQGAQRELTIKAAEWEIENLKFAVQQGIACENVLVNIFLNQSARMFEAAKYQVEASIQVYNAQITLYNARQASYRTAAEVFKIKIDAELAKLEVFKAQIQGELAKSQLNESKVKVFVAKIQALQTRIDLFKAQMDGARVQSEVIRTQVDTYKADTEAYATRIQAGKLVYDAYTARVGGEVAKAGIIDAEARAYSALISGKVAQADINIKTAQFNVEVYKEQVLAFGARVEAEKAKMQYQLNSVQAATAAYTADTQRFMAQVDGEKAKVQLNITAKETQIRSDLAYFDSVVKAVDIRMQKMIEEAKLTVQGLAAAGQIASTLTAGALAAVHVGAQISGSGGINAQGNSSDSYQRSDSTSVSTSTVTNIKGN